MAHPSLTYKFPSPIRGISKPDSGRIGNQQQKKFVQTIGNNPGFLLLAMSSFLTQTGHKTPYVWTSNEFRHCWSPPLSAENHMIDSDWKQGPEVCRNNAK